jgi:hypothetical protein
MARVPDEGELQNEGDFTQNTYTQDTYNDEQSNEV